jgi:hypothetical protein
MKRIVVRTLILAVFAVSTMTADAVCRYRGPQLPDGYITCKADCQYPANCQVNQNKQCTEYCYYDFVVGVCHQGNYEEGCTTGPLGF